MCVIEEKKVMIVVQLDTKDAALISQWIEFYGKSSMSSHGDLTTLDQVAKMLLEDVALAVRRPGSWEGSNMWQVLNSHGYGNL